MSTDDEASSGTVTSFALLKVCGMNSFLQFRASEPWMTSQKCPRQRTRGPVHL
jgi:hypothetical protein